jgi:hypothetical protein
LIGIRRVERFEVVPFAAGRFWIVEVVHDFDYVGVIGAVKLQVVLRLELRSRSLVVVVKGERRAIEFLAFEGAIDSFFMG